MTAVSLFLRDAWRNTWRSLSNTVRLRARRPPDYVVLDLAGSLPEHVPPVPWWQRYAPDLPGVGRPAPGLSLTALRYILERIGADPRPKGIVLRLDHFEPAGWATVQSVRAALARFQQAGKRVVVHAEEYSTAGYFVAAQADEALLAPGGGWNVLGLRIEATFLKDALDAIGVQAEVFNVSPYKAAGDMFSRAAMSPEHREMLDWLLDGQFEELVNALAAGRRMEPARMRELIDLAPHLGRSALDSGLVDGVCYFDEVAGRLYEEPEKGKNGPRRAIWTRLLRRRKRKSDEAETRAARLATWAQAERALLLPVRRRSGKWIGVVAVEGAIAPGESQRLPLPVPLPFVGQTVAGAETVSRALRRAETDDEIAAVVLCVDSRGGSSTASDAIWREVERLRRKKPVVAYLANTAASGGYYVAAGANWIVAQPLTVTGSIGVLLIRFVVAGLYTRLRAAQVSLERGARAGLFSPERPADEAEGRVLQGLIDEYYRQFREVVTSGRRLAAEALDPVAGGRVWLGRQALARGLVDELGDLHAAVEKAKELGKAPPGRWTPTVWVGPGRGHTLPPPFPAAKPTDWMATLATLAAQRVWMIAPVDVVIR